MTTQQSIEKLKANPEVIQLWVTRSKCWMCKRRFDKPVLLPTAKPEPGKFQPNINIEVTVHMMETHGMPTKDYVHNYVFNSVYGIENTFNNLYGSDRIFQFAKRGLD